MAAGWIKNCWGKSWSQNDGSVSLQRKTFTATPVVDIILTSAELEISLFIKGEKLDTHLRVRMRIYVNVREVQNIQDGKCLESLNPMGKSPAVCLLFSVI